MFSLSAAHSFLFAAASAGLAVVAAAVRSLAPSDNDILDVVTRVGLTLLQTFTAAFMTNAAGATHFSDWRAAAVAGLAAVLTALKGTTVVITPKRIKRATPASLIPVRPLRAG